MADGDARILARMSSSAIHQRWLSRRRRVRRVLRALPRRANVSRYPVIRRFAEAARSRPFLWSFKYAQVRPALYVGSVLAFLPTFGFQVLIAFAAALVVRANLTVMVALQMITNPLTLAPLYWATYTVGNTLVSVFGARSPEAGVAASANALVIGGVAVGALIGLVLDGSWRLLAWEARRFREQHRQTRRLG